MSEVEHARKIEKVSEGLILEIVRKVNPLLNCLRRVKLKTEGGYHDFYHLLDGYP